LFDVEFRIFLEWLPELKMGKSYQENYMRKQAIIKKLRTKSLHLKPMWMRRKRAACKFRKKSRKIKREAWK